MKHQGSCSKASGFFFAVLMTTTSLQAQSTWHAAGIVGQVLSMSPPGNCQATWYDPEVFLQPNGARAFLAQGGQPNPCTAGVGLDSIFLATFDPVTLTWQVPVANACPAVVGTYSSTSCPGQEFFAPYQPLASPAITKVGSRYYMAFSGGNADIRKGHIFWAYSDNGVNWVTWKWDPKPPGFTWRPLFYAKYGSFCDAPQGFAQLSLTYDPSTEYGPEGTFYLHANYIHSTGDYDTYTFRFKYTTANGFGLGGGIQICLNSGPRGTPCTWVNHSGIMVFDYDGQPAEPGDPILSRFGGNHNNFDGAGSLIWDPSHNNWLNIFTQFDTNLRWQTATSLSSGIWSAPQFIDMTQFHSQVTALYPQYDPSHPILYGGLWWGRIGTRTGMWLFQPANYLGCAGNFSGLGIFTVALNFF